ncbi:MAG: glycoside hydrolase family 38 C-terminal domain-containing protein, partial [Bryobacteraceae bacterium]
DELQSMERAGTLKAPTLRGGTEYDFNSFWIESPRVKSSYRRCEHHLQATEALATAASLTGKHVYPAQELYNAWTLLFLNMDRNTLWGSAGGMVFEHETSWDVKDRFEWVAKHTGTAAEAGCASLLPAGDGLGLFNPLNWERHDPVVLPRAVAGVAGQVVEGGVLCSPALASVSVTGFGKATASAAAAAREVGLPGVIKTKYYEVKIDPATGAIVSAKVHGNEMLAGPANVLVAEKPKSQHGDPGDFMLPRPERERLDSSNKHAQKIRVKEGPLATVVEVEGEFLGGGTAKRTMVFHKEYPRIDFSTELNDLPNLTVTVAEFPLAGEVTEVRRGIPYGFSHGAWAKPNADLHGWTKGIVPAVRWSHYALSGGGGAALLDRGVTGRELNGSTPILFLYNATDKYYGYPNEWLSGKGRHVLEYALVLHDGDWKDARIPQLAWEYNCPPVAAGNRGAQAAKSFLSTSDNVIVETMRRVDGDIEVRLVECKGYAGTAEVTLSLPHQAAAMTDLNGVHGKPMTGGPKYSFPVRAQQIVTLRFRTEGPAVETKLITQWDEMVPAAKLPMLRAYSKEKGHPPKGN